MSTIPNLVRQRGYRAFAVYTSHTARAAGGVVQPFCGETSEISMAALQRRELKVVQP